MDINVAFSIIRIVACTKEPLTTGQIAKRLQSEYTEKPKEETTRTKVRRCIAQLSSSNAGVTKILVAKQCKGGDRYSLNVAGLLQRVISPRLATTFLISSGSLGGEWLDSEISKFQEIAEELIGCRNTPSVLPEHRLRNATRIVPDGLGRCRAKIQPEIMLAVKDSIQAGEKLKVVYGSRSEGEQSYELSPLGLVIKDGTIYLIGRTGIAHKNKIKHFPLQRVKSVGKIKTPSDNAGFNIDDYINKTHQLSHPINQSKSNITLELRVAPEMIYHFEERPLTDKQEIISPENKDSWYTVKAEVPESVLLHPWLLSMGGWIEVVAPESVRKEIRTRIKKMHEHYINDKESQ